LLLQHKNPQQNQKIRDLNKNSQKKTASHASFLLSLSPKQLMTTEHRSIQRRNNLTYNKTAETRRNLHKTKKTRNDNNKTPVEDPAGSNKSSISVQKNSKNEKKSPQKNRTKNDNNCEEQRSKTTPQQD
jgi:hypothetical protein